jgi:predicted nucleotidyltransferase
MKYRIPSKDEIIKRSKIHPVRVKAIYGFGSRVYGTAKNDSDWDWILVANTPNTNQEIRSGNFNIHILTENDFLNCLKEHKSSQVEAFLSPDEFRILEEINIDWKPNISSLRHSFSHTSSNSWVKAKKKINQNEYYIGIKSLFHSLRIPLFGSQIAKSGKIYDFTEANWIHDEIFSNEKMEWDELDEKFRNLRNKILSDFRLVTQK